MDALAGQQHPIRSRPRRTSLTNWLRGARPTTTWRGSTWGTCIPSSAVAERIHAATVRRFTERFSRFNLPDTALRASYGLAEATRVRDVDARRARPRRSSVSTTRSCRPATRSVARANPVRAGQPRHTARVAPCGSSIPRPRIENPAGKVGEIWVHGDNVAAGYWRNPQTVGAHLRWTARRSIAGHAAGPGCGPGIWASCPTASCSSSAGSRIC